MHISHRHSKADLALTTSISEKEVQLSKIIYIFWMLKTVRSPVAMLIECVRVTNSLVDLDAATASEIPAKSPSQLVSVEVQKIATFDCSCDLIVVEA